MGYTILTIERMVDGIGFADVPPGAAFKPKERFVFMQVCLCGTEEDRPADCL
jgi:hypothetical protein